MSATSGVTGSRLRWLIVLLAFLSTSCESPTGPKAGEASINILAVSVPVAGLIVEVDGPGIESVVAASGIAVETLQLVGSTRTLLVSGINATSGTLLRIALADVGDLPTVRVLQAARGASGGYANIPVSSVTLSGPIL